jgi:hypothetical protein
MRVPEGDYDNHVQLSIHPFQLHRHPEESLWL